MKKHAWVYLLAGLSIALSVACVPQSPGFGQNQNTANSSAKSSSAEGEANQNMKWLYCLGFCFEAEVGSEAETETIQRVLGKVEKVVETENDTKEDILEIQEAVRDIDKAVVN